METMLVAGTLMYFVIFILFAIMFWKLFEKAGRQGWAALIPVYNLLVWIQITGKSAWWILFLLIPLINIIFAIFLLRTTAKVFGKGWAYTFGLLFLPFIFLPILALGEASYTKPVKAWVW